MSILGIPVSDVMAMGWKEQLPTPNGMGNWPNSWLSESCQKIFSLWEKFSLKNAQCKKLYFLQNLNAKLEF